MRHSKPGPTKSSGAAHCLLETDTEKTENQFWMTEAGALACFWSVSSTAAWGKSTRIFHQPWSSLYLNIPKYACTGINTDQHLVPANTRGAVSITELVLRPVQVLNQRSSFQKRSHFHISFLPLCMSQKTTNSNKFSTLVTLVKIWYQACSWHKLPSFS